jgi:hypothetical protein
MGRALTCAALSVLLLGALPASRTAAQAETTLARLDVDLRPEYDDPRMLVLLDFEFRPRWQR